MRGWMRRKHRSANSRLAITRAAIIRAALAAPALLLAAGMLPFGPLAVGDALAQQAGTPAPAQQQGNPSAAPTGTPGAPRTIDGSPLAQVPFDDKPFPLRDDGSYREFLNKVAGDVGRRCGKLETFGWEFRKGDQERMDHIFTSTMDSFSKSGWLVGEAKAKSVPDPETAVYLADKDSRRLLLLWVPMADAAMLILCETEGPAPKK